MFDNTLTASELMKMDMNKLSDELIHQFLKDNNRVQNIQPEASQIKLIPKPATTRPVPPAQRAGPP